MTGRLDTLTLEIEGRARKIGALRHPAVKELETKIKSGDLIVPKPTADPAKFNIKKLREIYG